MPVLGTPTFALQPSAEQVAVAGNYLGAADLNLLNQYLPDLYEKEFERYGDRSVSSFLRLVSAEIPSTSDLIKWTEEGRLHIKYTQVGSIVAAGAATGQFTVNDAITGGGGIAVRVGQTIVMSKNDGSGTNKALITATDPAAGTFDVAFYEGGGLVTLGTGANNADVTIFIYGSEFAKGTAGMNLSLEAEEQIFDNKPIILKDKYAVNGSDMAQIGWIEVDTDSGSGYLWYLKSASDTRTRFDDYLETSMIEAVPAEAGSGVIAVSGLDQGGSEGVFNVVENRGNVFGGGNPTTLAEFDTIVQRLDRQGAIEENVIFLNRQFGFDIDDMLAAQNSYGAGGTSYGLFDNDKDMALNLGFTGFRRGYDFYKTDWKYLNDATMRADLPSGGVNGLLVPAGSKTVYDQVLGKNAKRPYLHVRYRASATEDRKLKSWVTGSAGQAATNDVDEMEINFLSERCICTMGANNFMLFQD
jgi:hypothetical protein